MKKRLLKPMVAGLATILAIAGTGNVFGQTMASAGSPKLIQEEKEEINQWLNNINRDEQRIKSLKQQRKDEHKKGVYDPSTCAQLTKAKADLRKDKKYLKSDKTELLVRHQIHIHEHKVALREEKVEMRTAQRRVNRSNDAERAANQRQLDRERNEVQIERAKLVQAKIDRNDDVLAVNKPIKDANAQPAGVLAFENSSVRMQNRIIK